MKKGHPVVKNWLPITLPPLLLPMRLAGCAKRRVLIRSLLQRLQD
jgi:hypothetical protein